MSVLKRTDLIAAVNNDVVSADPYPPDQKMHKMKEHITVCICTYKRPRLLGRLLKELDNQETGGLFTYSIVVADNDRLQSAKEIVSQFASVSSIPVRYCVQPTQNIALTRNTAVSNASGEYIAFIDDDEFPAGDWLLNLFKTCAEYHADGAQGPVKPYFYETPPKWLVKGGFHERTTYSTGLVLDWVKGRTNNLLFKRAIVTLGAEAFGEEFLGGEDQDFLRRMIGRGNTFVWCNEALVYEVIPQSRWKRSFLLRRALFLGAMELMHPDLGLGTFAKSVIAVPSYLVALPFALFVGHHVFMTSLVKLSYHIGKLLGALGIRPIKGAYVTTGDC
jgi:succinoglycan biosynthesis protein ExoM